MGNSYKRIDGTADYFFSMVDEISWDDHGSRINCGE